MPAPPLNHPLPSALRAAARWERFGSIPVMLAHPDWDGAPAPVVIWLHGRTAHKELDPGRYLRLIRSGIGVCAVDLPGHGERLDPQQQAAERSLDVVLQMTEEIDEVVGELRRIEAFDVERAGIGGMSAGGMAALARLCRLHPFACASVEASTGSWQHQRHREMFRGVDAARVAEVDPIANLDGWREIPLQAFHSKLDQWVSFAGQQEFIDALRARYRDPSVIDFVAYERTGAPAEHIGFGQVAAEVKDRQKAFFRKALE